MLTNVPGVSQIRNFDDIKVWMLSIQTRSAAIQTQVNIWETASADAENEFDHWNRKCSWNGFWSEVGAAVKNVAGAIVQVSAQGVNPYY